jgi:hypothetical protein
MKRHNRLSLALYVIIGIFLGVTVIAILHYWVLDGGNASGCPTEYDQSVATAQVVLLGTVGGDYSDPHRDCWRESVVQPALHEMGVTYFNPVVENWTKENARIEANAIANAETLVIAITPTHPSIGALAESGWVVLSAIERDQTVIVYIDPEQATDDSQRARRIVLSQVRTLAPDLDQLVLVDSLTGVVQALHQRYQP